MTGISNTPSILRERKRELVSQENQENPFLLGHLAILTRLIFCQNTVYFNPFLQITFPKLSAERKKWRSDRTPSSAELRGSNNGALVSRPPVRKICRKVIGERKERILPRQGVSNEARRLRVVGEERGQNDPRHDQMPGSFSTYITWMPLVLLAMTFL